MKKINVVLIAGLLVFCGNWGESLAAELSGDARERVLAALGHPSAEEIVGYCAHQTIDDDLYATMTIINRHRNGSEKKSIYTRLVKNPKAQNGVFEKMLLISEFPPEAAGMAFLRWEYTPETGKYPDQWLYSPSLRNVRKVSVRDEEERFLGSTLTLADIAIRPVTRDDHRLLKVFSQGNGYLFYVESVAKNKKDAYSKRVVTYFYEKGWSSCRVKQIDFYDKKGFLQKVQKNRWQEQGGIWVWDIVQVENLQTRELSIFKLENVAVNVGLEDKIFSERTLRRVSKLNLKKYMK